MKNRLHIEINIHEQKMKLFKGDDLFRQYPVSTARNGPGELMDSECTPRGSHIISEKIGAGCVPDTVFVSREPTGELYTPDLYKQFPGRDWILTRILWLSGTEPGCNQGGNVDSHDRFIYIHGSPDLVEMGKPGSRGCVRMRNEDVMELFELVEEGTRVQIYEK